MAIALMGCKAYKSNNASNSDEELYSYQSNVSDSYDNQNSSPNDENVIEGSNISKSSSDKTISDRVEDKADNTKSESNSTYLTDTDSTATLSQEQQEDIRIDESKDQSSVQDDFNNSASSSIDWEDNDIWGPKGQAVKPKSLNL